jgi:hypothetical protein
MFERLLSIRNNNGMKSTVRRPEHRRVQWAEEDAWTLERRAERRADAERRTGKTAATRTEHYPIPEGSAMERLILAFERHKNNIIIAAIYEIAKANWSHLSNVETGIRNIYPENIANSHYIDFRADVDASKASWRDSSAISPHAARDGDAYSIVVAAKAHSEMWADNAGSHETQKLFLRNLRTIQSYAQTLPFVRNGQA